MSSTAERIAAEHRPGSDTRIRQAANALARDLQGTFGFLRERQWVRPSAGGEILVTPPCYVHVLLDGEHS